MKKLKNLGFKILVALRVIKIVKRKRFVYVVDVKGHRKRCKNYLECSKYCRMLQYLGEKPLIHILCE